MDDAHYWFGGADLAIYVGPYQQDIGYKKSDGSWYEVHSGNSSWVLPQALAASGLICPAGLARDGSDEEGL